MLSRTTVGPVGVESPTNIARCAAPVTVKIRDRRLNDFASASLGSFSQVYRIRTVRSSTVSTSPACGVTCSQPSNPGIAAILAWSLSGKNTGISVQAQSLDTVRRSRSDGVLAMISSAP